MEGGDVRFLRDYESRAPVALGHHLRPLRPQHAQLEGVQFHTGTVIQTGALTLCLTSPAVVQY